MQGLMMDMPLLISGLIQYAADHHGEAEIVAREIEGDIHRMVEKLKRDYGVDYIQAWGMTEALGCSTPSLRPGSEHLGDKEKFDRRQVSGRACFGTALWMTPAFSWARPILTMSSATSSNP